MKNVLVQGGFHIEAILLWKHKKGRHRSVCPSIQWLTSRLTTTGRSLFGSLEGVDLLFSDLDFHFLVGRHVAQTLSPFLAWGRADGTDRPDGPFNDPVAALAGFNGQFAGIALENAARFGPEGAFRSGKNCLTLHGYNLLAVAECCVLNFQKYYFFRLLSTKNAHLVFLC